MLFYLIPDPVKLGASQSWGIWLALSFTSPALTAACSAYQKRLLSVGFLPEDVLLVRFPLSAVAFGAWVLAARTTAPDESIPGLIGRYRGGHSSRFGSSASDWSAVAWETWRGSCY